MHKKTTSITALNERISQCHLCEGLNQQASQDVEATLNAPGYGDVKSKVVIIGQSLCGEPCINSQIPFTDGCGDLLDQAFDKCGVRKNQLYITNVVKCHPPNNRASKAHEKRNCREYLVQELMLLSPKVIICLGGDARDHFDKKAGLQTNNEILFNDRMINIHYLYHPSYIDNYCAKEKRQPYIELMADIIRQHHA